MKILQKTKFQKNGKIIKKYKLFGLSVLRKEILPFKKKWNLLGIKFCKKLKNGLGDIFYEKVVPPFTIFSNSNGLSTKRIAIIAETSIPQCTLYRITNKVLPLEELNYKIDISSWREKRKCYNILQTAEFVIFYRVPYLDEVPNYYKEAKRLGLKIVYDIDDLVFDVPLYEDYLKDQHLPAKQKKELIKGANLYQLALLNSDELWTTTKVIADVGKKYLNKVKIVPNCIPEKLEKINKINYDDDDDKVRIFYGSGTNTHDNDFKLCFNALNNILKKYKNVELYIHGYLNTSNLDKSVYSQVHNMDFIDFEDYYFSISGYDIALAPLERSVFSEAKSNIKYIEASMLKIPCIASDLVEFSSVIVNKENGFIAKTQKDWEEYLEILVKNKNMRKKIGEKAYETVNGLYSKTRHIEYLNKAIGKECNVDLRNRVLFVNILYGQSSFGGATIVTEKIAQNFNKNYENWSSFVFSCHIDNNENNLVRYDWAGVPVFSSSINGVDMSFENEDILCNFEKVIEIVKPDIVHFHCIQKIGINVVELCKEKHIPYVITMHDGWFICPRQFFLDKKNIYCDQELVSSDFCKGRCQVSNALFYKRKQKMYSILNGASWICTPSQSFTKQLQSNFNFTKLGVNVNGVSYPQIKLEKKNTSSKDLVFGFFGGREYVKGYFFLKEILQRYKRNDWKLILIDTARKFGINGINKEEWGDCNVEVLGYTPHEKMPELFNRIDVLLFPSEWNESFGLMVREAILNNVFVISSQCGGPSSSIVDGVNGLVFPKKNRDKFIKCLDYVFENKEKIKSYKTTNFGDIRTFSSQTDELKQKYEEILGQKENEVSKVVC